MHDTNKLDMHSNNIDMGYNIRFIQYINALVEFLLYALESTLPRNISHNENATFSFFKSIYELKE
jgi:hypothetical protein